MNIELLLAEAMRHHEDVARLAGLALELSQAHDRVNEAMCRLKEQLRERASHIPDNPVLFEGRATDGTSLGTVMVTSPGTQVKLTKDADFEALKEALGPSFELYFETTYKLKKEFLDANKAVPDVMFSSLEYVEPTPRVGFRPTVRAK